MLPEQFLEFHRRHGRAEVIALAHIAPQQVQDVPLFFGLYAFRDGLEVQAARQAGDRCDDRGGIGVLRNVPDEGHVDLEVIHRQLLDVVQRGVTGPEVVHGDRDAGVLQRGRECSICSMKSGSRRNGQQCYTNMREKELKYVHQ